MGPARQRFLQHRQGSAQAGGQGVRRVDHEHAAGGEARAGGLGTGHRRLVETWHGLEFEPRLQRMREYVEIVRKAWAREEPLVHHGRNFKLPSEGGTGLGKPLKLMAKPVQEKLPIYIGAIGPKSVELVGEIGDGWIPAFYDPDDGAGLLERLDAGLAKSGRDRSAIDVAPTVPVAVEDDVDEARNHLRPIISFYLGGMGAKDKNFYVDLLAANGLADEAHEVQDKFLAGDRIGAAMALTPEVIDMCGVACRPGELDERMARFEAAGADSVIAIPFGSDKERTVRRLAEL